VLIYSRIKERGDKPLSPFIYNYMDNFIGIDQWLIENKNDLVPIEPNRYVYHVSNPFFRDQIQKEGLIPKGKSETWLSNTPIEGKVIFACNSDNKDDWFQSTYDDDIYRIDTSKISNQWFYDPNFSWEKNNPFIITFEPIPVEAIELIYSGSGS